MTARCTAVEYFGSVRRYVFERGDGEVLKFDQFGAQPRASQPGQTAHLGWQVETRVLHTRGAGMSTIRPRSAAELLARFAGGAWMLGVVVVPIVLIVWVSFWGGRAFSPASPLTFDNYARFFANQTYLKLIGRRCCIP